MKHRMRMKTGIRRKRGGIWRRWLAGLLAAVMLAELVPVLRPGMRRMARRRRVATLQCTMAANLQQTEASPPHKTVVRIQRRRADRLVTRP